MDEQEPAELPAHVPVMVAEVLEHLKIQPGDTVVDGTVGSGGHARVFLGELADRGRLIGLDRDPSMVARARQRLKAVSGVEVQVDVGSFSDLPSYLRSRGLTGADAVLLDLGINSLQIEDGQRGFSFLNDGPLDARFNPEEGAASMADLLNTASESDLRSWLREYSDERWASKIARVIVRDRVAKPFTTTSQLRELVSGCYPPADRHGRIHPATRTFQALRIAVNRELQIVDLGIRACAEALNVGGRLVVLSYHSGEDRLAKRIFEELSTPPEDPSNPYSVRADVAMDFVVDHRKPVEASQAEMAQNPRSRSAKLRTLRRVRRSGGTA